MAFFSTPAPRDATPASPIVSAIQAGARKTGVGFDYLLKTAQRESALDPQAKARTSSATGLFQFIEQTWLSVMRQEGPRQGLGTYAEAISASEDGRLTVSDPAMRERILQLRNDPHVASVMAGALTVKNGEQLAAALGRQPKPAELYMAHVLGARGAGDLIRTAGSDPSRAAAGDFPEAAAANRAIFFDKSGRARGAAEVYAVLGAGHAAVSGAVAAPQPAAAYASMNATVPAAPEPAPIAAALAPGRAKGLIGLFSTEGPRAPVSAAVANLWNGARPGGARAVSTDGVSRYFPRPGAADGDQAAAAVAAASGPAPKAEPATPASTQAPLPPQRPADLALQQPVRTRMAAQRRGPLDLGSFMTIGRRG